MTRVFITGMGLVSSLGDQPAAVFDALLRHETGVRRMPAWEDQAGLRSHVAAPAKPYDATTIDRSSRRTMSPMSEMARHATVHALRDAGLPESARGERTVLCMGSTTGSPQTLYAWYKKYVNTGGPQGQLGSSFFKIMNHSVAANVAVDLKFHGAVIAPAAACCTATQALAMGWELLQTGLYDVVVAGGADELDPASTAIFDIVGAASTGFNDQPGATPRPFDRARDGLVVSEGAGVLVLETESYALQRGARPLAELNAGAYQGDGSHMAHPDDQAMAAVMRACLARSRLAPGEIDYVNAHATATLVGDLEEVKATHAVFGERIKMSSLKGHFGHSLAACGAIEAIASIEMMRAGRIIGTRNLTDPDPELARVHLVMGTETAKLSRVMVNNFAFGGISASVVISAMEG